MKETHKISYYNEGNESLSLRVYNIGQEQCQSLHQWGPGVRTFYLLHHIVSGKGIYKTGNKVYEMRAGSTFIIYPGTEITYIADEEDPWNYYWVGFAGNDAGVILNQTDFTKENPVIYKDPDDRFEKLLMKIYESKGNSNAAKIKMSGYLLLALSLFADNAAKKVTQNTSHIYIKKAVEYIEFNYAQKISVQEIADSVGISRSQLYRVFMETFHKSPMDYITDYRIRLACELLKHSQLSIRAVAYSVGFEDNLYFSRAFKKIKEMSPSAYMKNSKS